MSVLSPRQPPSFTSRIARSFLLLAMLTVSLVGTVSYICGRLALKDAAYDRLSMTATLKQKEIVRWLESCEEDFLLIAEFPTVTRDLQSLLSEPEGSAGYQAAYQRLSTYLAEIQSTKPKFTEISIQNRANQIILSTNPEREGKYEISANLTELESVVSGEQFAPIFYLSPRSGQPAITYASKVFDDSNERQGMILANLNLKRIDDIISERTGLDETGETYLVGSLANESAFLSRRNTLLPRLDGPQSEGITAAFRGENGQGTYENYDGEPVIGVYRWLAGQDIALLAEMGKSEAFGPARSLATTIVLVGLSATGILLLGVWQLARQLSNSRKQIESYSHQLEETAAAANAANRAKSDFLANMSHELRTPLNAILGFTQLMQRGGNYYYPSQHQHLGIISRSGEHLLNLINDVLSMSKIEAGRTTFDPVCFDLRYMLLTLEEMLRMRAEAKAIQLFVRVDETVPQFIKTDEVKLRQVLVNLIGNAIKFTQTGRVILLVANADGSAESTAESTAESAAKSAESIAQLTAEAPAELAGKNTTERTADGSTDQSTDQSTENMAANNTLPIFFEVKDTGPGIDLEELPHLFNPFFQASRTRTTQQGTGLGLAISQRFVNIMGGEIRVQSVLNEGSTFSFWIQAAPADPEELPILPLGEVTAIAPGQSAYRILVVEDVFSARQLMVALLCQVGFDVQAVTNGKEAIALYKTWQPHLIWMDMRMPIMDGYEATRQIRALAETHSPVKIIGITASAFERERAAVINSGCDDFVRKPFQAHVIFEKMADHLGVRYLYIDDSTATALEGQPKASPAPPIDPDRMRVMSADWLSAFHEGAIAVDAEALHRLIDQIPDEHRPLAEGLTHMIQNFCFDELVALTQTYA